MNEELEQIDQEEEEELTCPECGKGFQDMRGLTSHARHIHKLSKDGLIELIGKNESRSFMGSLIGAGAILLTILTLGRLK